MSAVTTRCHSTATLDKVRTGALKGSVTMRIGLKHMTAAVAAGVTALAIAAAPAAMADPAALRPAASTAEMTASAAQFVPAGHGGGFHGGGWHGDRGWGGGWHGDRGWHGQWWPWGWYR